MVKKIHIQDNDEQQNKQNTAENNQQQNHTDEEKQTKQSQKQSQDMQNQQQTTGEHQQSQQQDTGNEVDLEKKCQELEQQLKQLSDKYLRLAAEYDNYRKRTMREKAELIKTAGENILVDLLPVVDDFERALEHIDSANDIEALKEGVHLIYKRFINFLKSKGVEEIPALGMPLDTDLHEAVQQVPAKDPSEKGKIVHVVQKGYKLHDKVIRHAKVVVAM